MLKIDIAHKIKSSRGDQVLSIQANIGPGRITGIYGNSGEGKSTLFNTIAGFLKPNIGSISFNDKLWYDSQNGVYLETKLRKIAYIFQENNLFLISQLRRISTLPLQRMQLPCLMWTNY